MALCRWSTPFVCAGLLPFPFTTLGPRLGCLTPKAAPSILLPGSPILGPLMDSACCCKLVVKIAGSEGRLFVPATASPSEELMRALRVGCEGREGNVGDGWPSARSGIETLWPLGADVLLLRLLLPLLGCAFELDALRVLGKTDTEAARGLCDLEALGLCWPLELTVWITDWASGPS
jgi:hypothetical protein